MYIETERLIIRSTEPSDAKFYIDMASDGSLDEDIFCGCSYYEDEKQVGLVYFVGAEYRGKGYAAEAARAYAKYFLEHYEIPQLVVHIRNANKASCRTAENTGFILVDTRMYQDYGDEVEKLYNFYEMRR